MKTMRKVVSLLMVVTIVLTISVPVHASTTKIANWHSKEFKEKYAVMQKNESWESLNSEVKKQLSNYSTADRQQAEAILILRAIDLEVYLKQSIATEDDLIARLVDLLSSKEFLTCLLLSELARCDGIMVKKNAKGIYTIYNVEPPSLQQQ